MFKKLCDYRVYHNPRFHCAFPAAVAVGDDSVLVVFRRARDPRWLLRRLEGEAVDSGAGLDSVDHLDGRSHLVMVRLRFSADRSGLIVSSPEALPGDAEAADQDASLLGLGDGRLVLAGFTWYPVPSAVGLAIQRAGGACVGKSPDPGAYYVFWGGYTRLSADYGRTWTPHCYLPPLPGHRDAVPGARPFHGGAVRGRIVIGADQKLYLASYAPSPETRRHVSHLFVSDSGGADWQWQGVIAQDDQGEAGFPEPSLAVQRDGRLLVCHRSFGLGGRLVTATVPAGGAGGAAAGWQSHDLVGHPFDPLPLGQGWLLLVYGYRRPPYGIRARLWHPDRGAPEAAEEWVVRDDSPSADIGYPWAVALDDREVLIVYYFCDPAGVRHIAASRVAVSLP